MTNKRKEMSSDSDAVAAKQATLHDKLTILEWHHANGNNQMKTVRHFNVNGYSELSQSTLSRWVAKEAIFKALSDSGAAPSVQRFRETKNPELERCLSIWIDQMGANKFNALSGKIIRDMANKFYDKLQVPLEERLKLSNGWLDNFRARARLRYFRFYGEESSVKAGDAALEHQRIAKIISSALAEGYKLDDIFNMDETALFYSTAPDYVMWRESSKVMLMIALACNATGTERREPLFIGNAKQPSCFNNKTAEDLGFMYSYNKKAWMTSNNFRLFMIRWNDELKATARKIILFVDNFACHEIDPAEVPFIRLVHFAPNSASPLQPLDSGIIRAFKAIYRRLFIFRKVDELFTGTPGAYAMKIDQLAAMQLAARAWREVKRETIANCWTHCNLVAAAPPKQAVEEEEVDKLQSALDLLANTTRELGFNFKLLRAEQFVDNGECDELGHLTEDEIVEFVRQSTEEEIEDQPEEGEVSIPLPTLREAMSCAMVLQRFTQYIGGTGEILDNLEKHKDMLREQLSSRFCQQETLFSHL